MIDTIKLVIPYTERPKWIYKVRQEHALDAARGVSRTNINPGNTYKVLGLYRPRMTYIERPKPGGKTFSLNIELSLPKLMYGNNFKELKDTHFDTLTKKLSKVLKDTYGVWLLPDVLANATVSRVDYSKNIVFNDYTPVSTIINSMKTADISKVYDIQATNFKNGGHIHHIHTNSIDIAMYDKVADLKQEKISPKRSHEKDGYSQTDILNIFDNNKSVSVARFEVRLNGVKKIKAELAAIGTVCGLTFREMYSNQLARTILLKHWNVILDKIPKALLDTDTPEQLLLNIAKANPSIKAREALAIVGMKLIKDKQDERYVRNLMETLFSPSQYKRLHKKSNEIPKATQLKTLLKVSEVISKMEPISVYDYS